MQSRKQSPSDMSDYSPTGVGFISDDHKNGGYYVKIWSAN
jgi:hypothetical protein